MIILSLMYKPLRWMLLTILKKQGLTVGKNFFMGRQSTIDPIFSWLITIGDNVTLVARAAILAHDASPYRFLKRTKIGKVTIGNGVYIGYSAIILPGVTIGDDVVIGAGSVVTKDIPSRVVVNGNPATVTESIDDFIARKKDEMQIYPYFGKEYAYLNPDKKREMISKMKDNCGYIC